MEKIKTLISTIKAEKRAFEKFSKTFSNELALNFNGLEFFNLDERKITEIIAYFLNPQNEHDQGEIYLKIFLDKFNIKIEKSQLNNTRVIIDERTAENRMIDIYLECENEMVIGIENKTEYGTSDQPNQVADYIDELKKRNDNFRMFYLSPKGKELSENSIDKANKEEFIKNGKLSIINYEDDILNLIELFAQKTKNIRVKSFLEDFEIALKKKYLGSQKITTQEMIKDILKEGDNISLALEIESALLELKKKCSDIISDQFYKVADNHNLNTDGGEYIILKKYPGLFLTYELNEKNKQFWIGLKKYPQFNNVKIDEKLKALFSKYNYDSDNIWLISKTIYGNNIDFKEYYSNLKNEHFSIELEEFISNLKTEGVL